MLAYQQYAVHRQFAAAQGQRLGDGGIDLHGGEAGRALAAQVARSDLVHIKRDQIHGRLVPRAVPAVALPGNRSTKCCECAYLNMTFVIRAILGRAVEASHLRGARASQLPAAPANNSLRDIFMARHTSITK